jgi:hypothetical protein
MVNYLSHKYINAGSEFQTINDVQIYDFVKYRYVANINTSTYNHTFLQVIHRTAKTITINDREGLIVLYWNGNGKCWFSKKHKFKTHSFIRDADLIRDDLEMI